jgi:hypothetical protein
MDVPKDLWVSRLSLALKLEGYVFMAFWFLAYTMKFGMIWQVCVHFRVPPSCKSTHGANHP